MAITKSYLKSKPICKVTFTYKPHEGEEVVLVGDFNDWNPKNNPLKVLKNGTYKGSIDLETGKSYEFKYFVNGRYENDPEADSFQYNEFAGAENAVITV